MNITLLVNRDLASHLALSHLIRILEGQNISVFISEKVGADKRRPEPLIELANFENNLLNDGRPTFCALAQSMGCTLENFIDCDNQVNTPQAVAKIAATEPDLIISVRFGLILQDHVINLPKHGVINLHSGLLPDYRGVMASFRAMLNEDSLIGSTLHRISDCTIDSGAIIAKASIPLNMSRSYTLNVLKLYRDGCLEIGAAVDELVRTGEITTTLPNGEGCYYGFPDKADLHKFFAQNLRLFDSAEIPLINKLYTQT